jgi:hypothetical protein
MDTVIVAAGISAVVALVTTVLAAPLRVWVERNLQSHRLRAEYEYEQRRELRRLIGRYHGRLIEAAEQMHYRLLNIYAHDPERWLENPAGFYYKTTCYRLLHLAGVSRAFEREAFYIDARIAESNDLDFVKFVKAFLWSLVDPALFRGIDYDESKSHDHFFADQLRLMGEALCPREGECLSLDTFLASGDAADDPFGDMRTFVLGLRRAEDRLRWDRLVALHLLLVAFLNTVGYGLHKSSANDMSHIVRQFVHDEVPRNLLAWLPRLALASQPQVKEVSDVVGRSLGSIGQPA